MSVIAARQRTGSLVTLAAGVVAGAVGAGTSGADGVRAAAVGTVLVLFFLSAGALPLVVAGDGSGDRGRLGFLVLATTYALRLVAAIAVLTAASASGAVDVQVMGLTVIGCALVWALTQAVLGLRRRGQPGLDLSLAPTGRPGPPVRAGS